MEFVYLSIYSSLQFKYIFSENQTWLNFFYIILKQKQNSYMLAPSTMLLETASAA